MERQLANHARFAQVLSTTGRQPKILRLNPTKHPVLLGRESGQTVLIPSQELHATTGIVASKLAKLSATGVALHEVSTIEDDPKYSFDVTTMNNSYLKAAFLALFNFLGYRAVVSPALDAIRNRIMGNDESIPVFVGLTRQRADVKKRVHMSVVVEPERAQCLVVRFVGFNCVDLHNQRVDVRVALPMPTDLELHKYRLAMGTMSHPEQIVEVELDEDIRVRDSAIPLLIYNEARELQLTPARTYAISGELKEKKQ